MQDKLADYAGVGVQECWMVSIEDRNIEVLRLEGGEWRQAHIRGEGELLDSAALPGLELNIAGIFRGI
jgi:Uma2 family endonuclease